MCRRAVTYLIVHLPREVLKLPASVVQTLSLDVVVWCVRQKLMQCDDVAGNLVHGVREEGLQCSTE